MKLQSPSISRTAQDILLFLQEEALTRFPAFPEAFGRLRLRPAPGLSASLGTDGSHLFYHPELICEEFLHASDTLRQTYLHVHLHCLCFHILKPENTETELWNKSCDLCVELLASRLEGRRPSIDSLSMDARALLPLLQKDALLREAAGACARDTHQMWIPAEALSPSACSGNDTPKYDQSAGNGRTPSASEELRRLASLKKKWSIPLGGLQSSLSKGTGKRGLAAGDAAVDAALARKETIDYHSFLRQFTIAREEAILDTESFDYIPYHFGLTHYSNMPFLEPLEYQEVNRLDELAIAIDTSGSCSGRIVQRFLEETWSILRQRENFFSRMRLHLIQCDSMIQEHRIFTSVQEWEEALPKLKILGQGNTDFRPVFECLDQMIEKKEIRHLRGLLYFTDGDGIFPHDPPEYTTAFVFLNHRLEKQKIPDWALRLNLNLPEEF
ncbi:MAG: VWA-like domain-containing protein [Lachnospiraceae bacterium]|nr:VWA-like domain-containing protein [Lachnospiraceae bacterium]